MKKIEPSEDIPIREDEQNAPSEPGLVLQVRSGGQYIVSDKGDGDAD